MHSSHAKKTRDLITRTKQRRRSMYRPASNPSPCHHLAPVSTTVAAFGPQNDPCYVMAIASRYVARAHPTPSPAAPLSLPPRSLTNLFAPPPRLDRQLGRKIPRDVVIDAGGEGISAHRGRGYRRARRADRPRRRSYRRDHPSPTRALHGVLVLARRDRPSLGLQGSGRSA